MKRAETFHSVLTRARPTFAHIDQLLSYSTHEHCRNKVPVFCPSRHGASALRQTDRVLKLTPDIAAIGTIFRDSGGITVNAAADVAEPSESPALRCPATVEIFDVISAPRPAICIARLRARRLSVISLVSKADRNNWPMQLVAQIMKEFLPRVFFMKHNPEEDLKCCNTS